MEIQIIVGIVILIALVVLATIDMAFSQLSDISLRRLTSDTVEDSRVHTPFLREIIKDRAVFRFSLSAAIQILLIIFSVLVTLIVYGFVKDPVWMLVLSLAIGLTLSGIFRQFIPRFISRRDPESKLLFVLPVIRPIYPFLSFLADPFWRFMYDREQQRIEATVTPDADEDRDDDNADDIQALIEVGEAEGIIEEHDRQLIETMVEFSDTMAGQIMTPRTEICAVQTGITIREARDVMVVEKYSRLPVYRDAIDNIEGVIYVRDLLQAWADGREDHKIDDILRDVFFVPETKSAAELLKSMQANHVQIAIVIDEYGGVAGLVTVEDILEEIVGEIEDEDIEKEEIIEIVEGSNGYFDVLGSTDIDKVERLFDLDLEGDEVSTIAGLVTSDVGYVPKPGEKLSIDGLDIEVLKADDKKIELLRLRKNEPEVEARES
jgi:putative hemolysin